MMLNEVMLYLLRSSEIGPNSFDSSASNTAISRSSSQGISPLCLKAPIAVPLSIE